MIILGLLLAGALGLFCALPWLAGKAAARLWDWLNKPPK